MSDTPPVRLAHFSDLHLTSRPLGWTRRDWLTKRVTGWLNLRVFGRGYRFRHSLAVARALARDLAQRKPDRAIFSGDATMLGFESEYALAAQILQSADVPGLAVPGNHDYYLRRNLTERTFERHFADWQQGERLDDATYPFAQRVGHVWLIGVNSSIPNRMGWDATGSVGPEQRQRLAALLARLAPGPRIVVTHYPLCLASGRPEPRFHRLRDWRACAQLAAEAGVSLWLHGHRHRAYWFPGSATIPLPTVCAGSVAQTGRMSYNEYTISGWRVHVSRREYLPQVDGFAECETFAFEMPGALAGEAVTS
jgi:3',5'-cyclic AMP phosphodiesterase CpdA